MRPRSSLVLGVHPTSRGYGWIAYEGPFSPYAWATVEVSRNKNPISLEKLGKLLARLQPETLVLEAFEPTTSERRKRITKLCRALVALAVERGIEVAIFPRSDVQACFAHVGANTRQEVAEAVARHTPALEGRLPKKRRAWDSEDLRMALFSAAALVITHYALDARRLLDDLRGAS